MPIRYMQPCVVQLFTQILAGTGLLFENAICDGFSRKTDEAKIRFGDVPLLRTFLLARLCNGYFNMAEASGARGERFAMLIALLLSDVKRVSR